MIFQSSPSDHSLANSCWNLTESSGNRTNHCELKRVRLYEFGSLQESTCMQCHMRYASFKTKPNCSTDLLCASLVFDSLKMVQRFFEELNSTIRDRYPTQYEENRFLILEIIVANYNISKITNEYITSTMNIAAPDLDMFVTFQRRRRGFLPLTVLNENYKISFHRLVIKVQCNYGNTSVMHVIYGFGDFGGELFIIGECPTIPSTPRVSYDE